MAYQIYTTTALVCSTFDKNTADRSYLLFSREAGMLYADARSVREERSRQRYALQDFSLVKVSLVKGKAGWRIGSVEALKNYYHAAVDKAARGSVVSIFRLLRRFLKGEEAAVNLFDYTLSGLDELAGTPTERQFVEMVVQVRILSQLGYVDEKNIPSELLKAEASSIVQFADDVLKKKIENIYTQAIAASHL